MMYFLSLRYPGTEIFFIFQLNDVILDQENYLLIQIDQIQVRQLRLLTLRCFVCFAGMITVFSKEICFLTFSWHDVTEFYQ